MNSDKGLTASLFGVFDGHDGKQSAQFLRENLLKYLVNTPEWFNYPEDSLKRAIAEADLAIGRNQQNGRIDGATAVVALIADDKLCVANLGDCR